jgi:hypothetical protein
MSIKIALLVYNVDNKDLSSSEKHVLVRLAICGKDDGINIYPSYEYISKQIGFSRRGVIKVMNRLTQKGFLKKKKRRKKNENNTNYYVIDLKKLKELQGKSGDLNSPGSEYGSLGGECGSLPLVNEVHHPSEWGSPKSNLKVNKKVNTHSQVDFAGSVDGVCVSSLSQKEFQAKELGFQSLCHLWPKKEGLEAAQKIYSQIVPEEISSDRLFDAAKTKIESLNSQYLNESERVRYCPQLNNWLREKRYLDQPHISKQMSHVQASPREMRTIAAMERSAATVRQLMRQ